MTQLTLPRSAMRARARRRPLGEQRCNRALRTFTALLKDHSTSFAMRYERASRGESSRHTGHFDSWTDIDLTLQISTARLCDPNHGPE